MLALRPAQVVDNVIHRHARHRTARLRRRARDVANVHIIPGAHARLPIALPDIPIANVVHQARVDRPCIPNVMPFVLSTSVSDGPCPGNSSTQSAAGCVYALDSSASQAVNMSNGVSISSSCGVIVDSSSSTALSVIGGAKLTTTSVGVVGNYIVNNGGYDRKIYGRREPDAGDRDDRGTRSVGIGDSANRERVYLHRNANLQCVRRQPDAAVQWEIYHQSRNVLRGNQCEQWHLDNIQSGTYILAGGGMSLQNGGGIPPAAPA